VLSPLDFSFSPAEAPPEELDSLELPPLEGASSDFGVSLEEEPDEELSPDVLFVLVDVVEVEVVWTAAFSALVSVGGMMSGVLLGTASETLLLPQAPSVIPPSSATHALSAMRALTARPRWRAGRWPGEGG